MKRPLFSLLIAATAALPFVAAADTTTNPHRLWYKQPGVVQPAPLPWNEGDEPAAVGNIAGKPVNNSAGSPWASQSLPVGNGRVGGTLFGGDKLERIVLNEISLWSGGPNLPGNGNGYAYGPTSGKDAFGSYQPFANLYIDFDLPEGKRSDYVRELDLMDGIARNSFSVGGLEHERECFVSEPADVLVYRASARGEGTVNARIALTPYHNVSFKAGKDSIIMRGTLANGEVFEGRVLVKAEGGSAKVRGSAKEVNVRYEGGGARMTPVFDTRGIPYIEVKGASYFTLYVSLATDYKMSFKDDWKGKDPAARNAKLLKAAAARPYEALRREHVKDHQSLYRRVSLNLGKTESRRSAMPTDERLAAYRQDADDPGLEVLLYQYGRYMLIAGSRPGNLPLTLQGIWNEMVHAPWASDYHNNINLQMCYWGAEVANLSECHLPFIAYMKAMEEPLENMTRKHFGEDIRGWTTRISQNPWGGGGWTHWNPPVNAWYALHVWDHYLFTQDKNYLRKVAYPMLRNICAFWETRLKKLGDKGAGLHSRAAYGNGKMGPLTVDKHPELAELKAGTLVSPEGWSHEWGPVEDGCMHDQQLIWELFDITARAARELGTDAGWAKEITRKRNRLAPNRIAEGGYLQEWIVDRPNMVRGQRHTSHLIGVFPGSTITMSGTPELAKAAAKSLELRGLTADNRRSWTWPWRTALWARLGEPEKAHDMVEHYIRYNLLDNLFGNHAPMQLDGTYGITGGISEMLLQSHGGQIVLLPALPEAWQTGGARGIRARGNITVDMDWKDGKVTRYRLSSSTPQEVTVVVNGKKKKEMPELEEEDTPSKKSSK